MNTAIVWGGSGGIGRAVVDGLSAAGWRVLAVARDSVALEQAGVAATSANFTSEHDVAAATFWAAQQTDRVDMWVYAAGDMLGKPLADTSAAELGSMIGANLTGAHLALTHSLPLVPPGGTLAFVGAYVDTIKLPKLGAYAASKAALDAYVTVLGKELRDRNVINLRLGAVDTPLWRKAPFRLPKGARQPSDVASALLDAYSAGSKGNVDL